MLPTGKKDTGAAMFIVFDLDDPYFCFSCVWIYRNIITFSMGSHCNPCNGVGYVRFAFNLYQKRTNKAARTLMLVSVTYISLVQIVYIIDRFTDNLWI